MPPVALDLSIVPGGVLSSKVTGDVVPSAFNLVVAWHISMMTGSQMTNVLPATASAPEASVRPGQSYEFERESSRQI